MCCHVLDTSSYHMTAQQAWLPERLKHHWICHTFFNQAKLLLHHKRFHCLLIVQDNSSFMSMMSKNFKQILGNQASVKPLMTLVCLN